MPDNVPGADYERVLAESRAMWSRWLSAHHRTSPGVWLARWKKGSGHPTLSYEDVVDEAIRFGWVDSRPRSLNSEQSLLLVTPRKPTSNWSRINKERAERLLRAGLMTPAGQTAVDTAKLNGTWDALNTVESLIELDDLSTMLDDNPEARRFWSAFPRSTRRAILEWISSAKTPDTRSKRIERTVADAANNIRANQWRQPKRASHAE